LIQQQTFPRLNPLTRRYAAVLNISINNAKQTDSANRLSYENCALLRIYACKSFIQYKAFGICWSFFCPSNYNDSLPLVTLFKRSERTPIRETFTLCAHYTYYIDFCDYFSNLPISASRNLARPQQKTKQDDAYDISITTSSQRLT
jgi:hypothetical protein